MYDISDGKYRRVGTFDRDTAIRFATDCFWAGWRASQRYTTQKLGRRGWKGLASPAFVKVVEEEKRKVEADERLSPRDAMELLSALDLMTSRKPHSRQRGVKLYVEIRYPKARPGQTLGSVEEKDAILRAMKKEAEAEARSARPSSSRPSPGVRRVFR